MSELNHPKISQGEQHAEQAYKAHSNDWDELIAEREAEYQQQYTQSVYDENRPYQDANGAVHSPVDNKFVNPDKYFDEQRDIHAGFDKMDANEDHDEYQGMGLKELSMRYAEAEFHNDKTTSQNISEVIDQKVDAQAYKNDSPQVGDEIRENLYNMVLKNASKHQGKLQYEQEMTNSRDRIDPENAASVMHEMQNLGVPDEIIKNVPKENFYREDDPEKSDKLPQDLKDWMTEKAQDSKNKAEDDPISLVAKTKEELDKAKALLAETDAELAQLEAQSAGEQVASDSSEKGESKSPKLTWKQRIARLLDPNKAAYDSTGQYLVKDVEKARKQRRIAAGAGVIAMAATALLATKVGLDLTGNKSSHNAETAGFVNPFKGLDIGNIIELATGKTAQAAEHVPQVIENAETAVQGGQEAQEAHEAWKGTVSSGEGPTFLIQDMLESNGIHLSPEQLYDVYSQNESFFTGLENTYSMPNGDIGFQKTGNIQIPYDVMEQIIRDAKELSNK